VNIKCICEKGGRPYNQDYVDYAVAGDYLCIAVADGLGAYDGSEDASETAVKRVTSLFRRAVKKEDDLFCGSLMNKMFKSAHSAIHKMKADSPELRSACTTLSVVIIGKDKLICAHTGDSRIYFFKNNVIEFYSKDHSLARLAVEKGEITYSQIRNHPDQNKLTRVLGSDYFVQPDFKIHEGHTDKDAILVCTDGLWEYVLEGDMENTLASTSSASEAMSELIKIHDENAPAECDNFSAVLAFFGEQATTEETKETTNEESTTLEKNKSEN
jgi:serine/threonine protein phosphatase PrpC